MGNQRPRCAAQLISIMRWNGRCHPHRNTGGAIGQQIRKGRGQHHGLFFRAVIGFAKIDRALINILQQQLGGLCQACFGITHRRSAIAIDIAEIALPLDQRIARGKILCQPHQRVINGLITMRMKLTDDVPDNPRRLLERIARIQFQHAHRMQNAAVDGLQPVAGIRQGALSDRRQGIGEIALGQRLIKRFFENFPAFGGEDIAHAALLIRTVTVCR